MRGKIFAINKKKGYGFIMSEEIPFTRIFFHWTSLIGNTKFTELHKNQIVDFEVKHEENVESDHAGGYSAIKITVVDNPIIEARISGLNED